MFEIEKNQTKTLKIQKCKGINIEKQTEICLNAKKITDMKQNLLDKYTRL